VIVSDSVDRNKAAELQQPPPEEGEPTVTDHPEMTPQQRRLENLARRLRTAYFTRWDMRVMETRGRSSNHTIKDFDKWIKIAEVLVNLPECDPESFMAYHFYADPPPLVKDLVAKTNVTDYVKYCREVNAVCRTQLERNVIKLRQDAARRRRKWPELTEEDALRDSLVDLMVKTTALFRYCAAVERGWMDIAAKFRELAMEELLVSPEGYKRTWSQHLPPPFLEELDAQLNEVQ
jgi:hypothetical protein